MHINRIILVLICLCECCIWTTLTFEGKYLGCYTIPRNQRRPLLNFAAGRVGTIDQCIDKCRNSKTTFASVENGGSCGCGDRRDYNRYGSRNRCNIRCSGDASQTCGGYGSVNYFAQVYTVCAVGYYIDDNKQCTKQCHCNYNDVCTGSTGQCPRGCVRGWTGNGCQYKDCTVNNGGCKETCVPNKERDWCDCLDGYNVVNITACEDIDECVVNNPCNHVCNNIVGSYNCSCWPGYSLINETTCEDIDECDLKIDVCEYGCNNTEGNYTCLCPEGYELINSTHCADIDECSRNMSNCTHNCHNNEGSYTCSCYKGYTLADNYTCADIDECETNNGDCDYNCTNTEGSYSCDCGPGLTKDSEDQCVINADKFSTDEKNTGSFTLPVALGVSLGILAIAAILLVILFVLRRRKSKKTNEKECENGVAIGMSSTSSHDDVKAETEEEIIVRGKEKEETTKVEPPVVVQSRASKLLSRLTKRISTQIYENTPKMLHNAVLKENLGAYVNDICEKKDMAKNEFEGIPQQIGEFTLAKDSAVTLKNRFRNILPYDHNRVKLKLKDDPHSDYINASPVKCYLESEEFIASHGPNKKTLRDFWRMIWEQKCFLVVMLTNPIENGKRKCEKYWPSLGEKPMIYEDLVVKLESESQYRDYAIRTLKVAKKEEDSEEVSVMQYHYTSWPDHDVPNVASLLRFRNKVRAAIQPAVTTLVHCSAGVGRTGTLLALDWQLQMMAEEDQVDVYHCVHELRKQRMNMVQNLDQYIFIYKALFQAVSIGTTTSTVNTFKEMEFHGQNQTAVEKQYQVLKSFGPSQKPQDTKNAKNKDNAPKNRSSVLPASTYCVHLNSNFPKRNTYINAVFVPSTRRAKAFISTQWPMENTIVDFWRMVLDLKIQQVIILEDLTSKETFPSFLPQEVEHLDFQKFTVVLNKTSTDRTILMHDVTLWKGQPPAKLENVYANAPEEEPEEEDSRGHNVKVVQLSKTDEDLLTIESLIRVKNAYIYNASESPPVVVCRDGASVCGVYIAAHNLMEMVDTEEEVDVYYVVQLIRTVRPEFISSLEQYKHLYLLVKQFIDERFSNSDTAVYMNVGT